MDKLTPSQFKAARLAMSMTQKQMAAWLYTNDRRIRAWEKGENPIPGSVRRCIGSGYIINTKKIATDLRLSEDFQNEIMGILWNFNKNKARITLLQIDKVDDIGEPNKMLTIKITNHS